MSDVTSVTRTTFTTNLDMSHYLHKKKNITIKQSDLHVTMAFNIELFPVT